ncbi:unnamed protein product [Cylindrotheca closterium]|uniref:Uncharacterized protein n=1 Tax=Cylindrotheca closterium TaxID=2856 RepID=A0AAD2CG04_9STRA|nr:unnamed protein product [Cylindrotheca closterium]
MARGGGRAGRHGQGGRGRGGGRGQPRRPRGRAYTRKEFETVFEVLRVWLPITAPEWMKCADLINQKLEQPRPWDSIRQKFNKLIRAVEPSGDTEPGWEVLQARSIAAEIRIRMDGSSGGSDDEFVAGGSDSDNDDGSGENGGNSNGNGGVATNH